MMPNLDDQPTFYTIKSLDPPEVCIVQKYTGRLLTVITGRDAKTVIERNSQDAQDYLYPSQSSLSRSLGYSPDWETIEEALATLPFEVAQTTRQLLVRHGRSDVYEWLLNQ